MAHTLHTTVELIHSDNENLPPEQVENAAQQLAELRVETLSPTQVNRIRELGPRIDDRLNRLQQNTSMNAERRLALQQSLQNLRATINRQGLVPTPDLGQNNLPVGMARDTATNLAQGGSSVLSRMQQSIRDNPATILYLGAPLAAVGLWYGVKWVGRGIRRLWGSMLGKIALLGGAVAGGVYLTNRVQQHRSPTPGTPNQPPPPNAPPGTPPPAPESGTGAGAPPAAPETTPPAPEALSRRLQDAMGGIAIHPADRTLIANVVGIQPSSQPGLYEISADMQAIGRRISPRRAETLRTFLNQGSGQLSRRTRLVPAAQLEAEIDRLIRSL